MAIRKILERNTMKQSYIRITIEAPSYEAKATADHFGKDRKYEVISRSKSYPCEGTSNVRIYLRVAKKTQLGYKHDGGWDKKHGKKRKHQRINYEALMMPSYH